MTNPITATRISSLKTKLSGAAGILVAILVACQNDPHFAKWAIPIGLAINAIGNYFSRTNDESDQKAGARPPVPGIDTEK